MYPHETRIYIAILIGVIIFLSLIGFFIVTIVRYQRKKVAFHVEKIKEQFYYLDKERERISKDLHDDLGASLSAIKLRLQCLKNLNNENSSIIENAEMQIDEVMKKIRHISFNMMPGVLQRRGLDEALKELIDIVTDNTDITVNYKFHAGIFEKNNALHIYRIAQEILNNIVKHSKATVVNFTIVKIKSAIELSISDNGIGFKKKEITTNLKGAGLKNISWRADILKAKVYLTTTPGNGVDYLFKIPI